MDRLEIIDRHLRAFEGHPFEEEKRQAYIEELKENSMELLKYACEEKWKDLNEFIQMIFDDIQSDIEYMTEEEAIVKFSGK